MKQKELAWSLSRGRMFEECPRRYYYHYYMAGTGYAPDAPEEAKLALEMKRLKGLDMWVGEVVHSTIQRALELSRTGDPPSSQEMKEDARRRLSEGWRRSKAQEWRTQPEDDYPALFDHYYGIEVGPSITDRLKAKTFVSVENFAASDVFKTITNTPAEQWLPIEKYASFRIDGLLMYVKFDFALRRDDNWIVYDWKTGNPTADETRQLTCYALFTMDKWRAPMENTRVCAVHLQPELSVNEHSVTDEDIEDLRLHVKQGFNSMVNCLQNPARNIAAMQDFPMTGNLVRCVRCNFRGICEQGKQAAGELEEMPPVEGWEEV